MNEITSQTRILSDEPYNPAYGDDRLCICGHPYHRHFDGYENNANVGCKYCDFSSQAELDALLAEEPDMAKYIKFNEWCAGFTPADGVDTPDADYEIWKDFADSVAEQAKALIAEHPHLALKIAREWINSSADDLITSKVDAVACEAAGIDRTERYNY